MGNQGYVLRKPCFGRALCERYIDGVNACAGRKFLAQLDGPDSGAGVFVSAFEGASEAWRAALTPYRYRYLLYSDCSCRAEFLGVRDRRILV